MVIYEYIICDSWDEKEWRVMLMLDAVDGGTFSLVTRSRACFNIIQISIKRPL